MTSQCIEKLRSSPEDPDDQPFGFVTELTTIGIEPVLPLQLLVN